MKLQSRQIDEFGCKRVGSFNLITLRESIFDMPANKNAMTRYALLRSFASKTDVGMWSIEDMTDYLAKPST